MKKKVTKPASHRERSYPSVLDLAMRAGKWSVLVGGSALIIGGTTGCEEETSTPGVIALDGWVDETQVNEDTGTDQNITGGVPYYDINDWNQDIQTADVVDVVEVDQGIPLAGEPPIDIIDDPGDVVTPDDVVTSDVDTDPGLLGDPIVDSFIGGSDADVVDIVDVTAE
jgi:hypothetical protein